MVFVPTLDVDAHAGTRGILGAGVLAHGLGAGLLHAASAPAWSTALVGL